MPLLPGKINIGKNIETEEAHGKPHDQALAIALSKVQGRDASNPPLKALYGEDDAKLLLKEAKAAGFSGSTRSGSKVTVAGFSGGNGPDEARAWQRLKQVFPALHVEVSTIGRDALPAPIPVDDQVLGHGAVGDDLMSPRDEERLNKSRRAAGSTGVEAYGIEWKNGRQVQWRKAFKSVDAMNKWLEQGDREVHGTRSANEAYDAVQPIPAPIPMNCKDEHLGFAKLPMNDESTGAPWICPYDGPVPTRKCPYCGYDCKHSAAKDEHLGFAKLEHSLAHKKGVSDPDALAAAIGRKKYGTAGMAARSAAARDDTAGNLRAAAAVKALEDLERAERQAAKMASTVNADHFVRPFKDRYEKARQAWKAGMARAKDAKDPWYDERIKELEQEVARCKREGEPYADELRDIAEYKKERDDRARAVARSMSRDALPEPV